VAGLLSQAEIVDAQGEGAAGVHLALLAAGHRDALVQGGLGYQGHGGGDDVVRGHIDDVHLVKKAYDSLLDLVGAGDGQLHHGKAQLLQGFLGQPGLDLGVDLAAGVQQAYPPGIGHHAMQQGDLLRHRVHVRGARHIEPRGLVAVDELGRHIVRDRGAQDGDAVRPAGQGQDGRGGDAQGQVDLVSHEHVRDAGAGILAGLAVLIGDADVFAVLIALLGQGLDKALPGRVQGRMLHKLQNAHRQLLFGLEHQVGAHRQHENQRQNDQSLGLLLHFFHVCPPPFRVMLDVRLQKRPLRLQRADQPRYHLNFLSSDSSMATDIACPGNGGRPARPTVVQPAARGMYSPSCPPAALHRPAVLLRGAGRATCSRSSPLRQY